MTGIDPLIQAVIEKLPTDDARFPNAPRPQGARIGFKNRPEWIKLLNAALDVVYGEDIPDLGGSK